jgi:hypothetical protein
MVTSVMVSVARTFGVSLQTGLAVQIAIAIPVIAVAVWAIRQTADPARRAMVLVSATLLATPYAMVYDFPALTAVIAWRLFAPRPLGMVRSVVLLAAWLLPLGALYLSLSGLGVAPLVLLGVFAIAVGEAVADSSRTPRWSPFRPAQQPSGAPAAPQR